MKKWLFPVIILAFALAVFTACSAGTAIPTPTSTPSPTPTPLPVKEWDMEDIRVDDSTVTVLLRTYAGIDVRVTLDGKLANRVLLSNPGQYVFWNVASGEHTVEVQDVVGYLETAEVVVSTSTAKPTPTAAPTSTPPPTAETPNWLRDLIWRLENEPVTNPPLLIARYEYEGQTVYFLPQRCCDVFSDLYDAEGNLIGHPDGGITGQGDGRVQDFFQVRQNESVVWRDKRPYDPGLVQTQAPIESVDILVMESFPLQYSLVVVSGIPNACVSYGGYYLTHQGTDIRINMVNWQPSDPRIMCALVYRTVETVIPLGSKPDPNATYTVDVNGVSKSF